PNRPRRWGHRCAPRLNPVQYIDSMGLASKYGHLNNGGYGARPNKPPTPDPSKLPDIAKQLRLPYPIDQASSAPNVLKTLEIEER
ncbi:hypothetical protein ACUOFC_61080, partial [Escherichia sp. TWPC-MK]